MTRFEKVKGGEGLKYFNQLKFVAKALRSDKDGLVSKRVYSFLYATKIDGKNMMVSSDTRRLHYFEYDREKELNFDEGFYRVITNNAKEILIERLPKKEQEELKFPELSYILPREAFYTTAKKVDLWADKNMGNAKVYFPIYKEGILVNSLYLDDAVIVRAEAFLDPGNKMAPVVIHTEYGCKAIIMPIMYRP